MKIENLKFNIRAYKVDAHSSGRILSASSNLKTFKLTETQVGFLEKLSAGMTLEQIAQEAIRNKTQISFKELYLLVKALIEMELVHNHEIRNYFEHLATEEKNLTAPPVKGEKKVGNWTAESLSNFPFFRSLQPNILAKFIEQTSLLQVPERTKMVSAGDFGRDLFVILEGEASVYQVDERKRRQFITTIPAGSVFGESAFLLNRPRSADVITNVPSVIAKITFDKNVFESAIKSVDATALQQRLRILLGLLSSPLFHKVPADTLDRFIEVGKPHLIHADEVVFAQGLSGTTFFVVIQGEVDVIRNEKKIQKLKTGDVFGEVALLISSEERVATVRAKTDGLLLEISKDEFFEVLAQNLILAKNIEEVASRRYRDLFR